MSLVENFERAAAALSHDERFRDLEIVAQRARRNGRTLALTLVVDRPGGADLRLCEGIAARLNAQLDLETEPYTLEVESAGLERPLVRPSDYERFRERNARIVTTLPIGGAKTHRGMLAGMRGNLVILRQATGELPIPFEMVKSAKLEFDPRADLRREKQERKGRRWR